MASLLANVAIVQAAEECRLSPGTAAPPGSKWLYRINRADHRHCWFLSSKAGGPHSQLARRHRHLAGEEEAARQDQQGDSDQQAASAPISKNDVAEAVEPPTAPQVAPLSVEPSSENLIAHSVPTQPRPSSCHYGNCRFSYRAVHQGLARRAIDTAGGRGEPDVGTLRQRALVHHTAVPG